MFAPSRGRELKWLRTIRPGYSGGFAPSRGRELKSLIHLLDAVQDVRPLAGAGIEISRWRQKAHPEPFAPSRGRELK